MPPFSKTYLPLIIAAGVVLFLLVIALTLAGTGRNIALRTQTLPLSQDRGGVSLSPPQFQQPTPQPEYDPSTVLIKVKPDSLPQGSNLSLPALKASSPLFTSILTTHPHITQAQKLFSSTPTTQQAQSFGLDRIFKLTLTRTPQDPDAQAVAQDISTLPGIEYAEPDYIAHTTTNDPYFNSQGSWGQSYDDLWGIKKIKSDQAWPITEGSSVIVAVIDTGIRSHPDLNDRLWTNADEIANNGRDDDNNGYVDDTKGWDFASNDNNPDDGYGHGTHVAGTIGATGNNSIGVIGVAPKVAMMPIKGLSDAGFGWHSDLALAVRYAADNGAHISSNSWGGPVGGQVLEDAFNYAKSRGMTSIAAAGNSWNDRPHYPAVYDSVIAVAATTPADKKTGFSTYGTWVDVSAPGGGVDNENGGGRDDIYNILSTTDDRNGFRSVWKVSSGYWRLAGTSMATPHVSGVAALIKAKNPSFTPDQMRARICASTDNIDALNPQYVGKIGSGRINAYLAVTGTGTGVCPVATSTPTPTMTRTPTPSVTRTPRPSVTRTPTPRPGAYRVWFNRYTVRRGESVLVYYQGPQGDYRDRRLYLADRRLLENIYEDSGTHVLATGRQGITGTWTIQYQGRRRPGQPWEVLAQNQFTVTP